MYSSVAPPGQEKTEGIPSGISEENWMKFQRLKERRQKICKKYPDKKRKRQKTEKTPHSIPEKLQEKKDNEKKWEELKEYFPKTPSECATVTLGDKYDKEIKDAVKKGNFKEAESLSDQLVTKDFLSKAANAIKSRDFEERRKAEEEQNCRKRKKQKLHWGFEQKERWESKGNM